MWTAAFYKALAERAVSTFAWTLLGVLSVAGLDLMSAPWGAALSAAGMAAVLSVLKSLAVNYVSGNGPSLATERLSPVVESHGRHERPE